MDYIKFKDEASGKHFICMKDRLQYVTKQAKLGKTTILETFKGEKLVGTQYQPLFPYFEEGRA